MRIFWLFTVLALTGCVETPQSAFKQIQGSACKGDLGQFYSRVDWHSIKTNMLRRANGNALIEAIARQAVNEARQAWDDDIRLGSSGSWCRATMLDSEGAHVFWSTPGGVQKEGTFDKVNGKYLLVAVK